jgi:adenylylsulfate kinase-like enzyme
MDFTGISSLYEEPLSPEVEIFTENLSVKESVERILAVLLRSRLSQHRFVVTR